MDPVSTLFVKDASKTFQQTTKKTTVTFVVNGALGLMAGVDPGFVERGFICIKVWGFALLILSLFLKYPMKMK